MSYPFSYSFVAPQSAAAASLNTSTYTTVFTSIPVNAVSLIVMTTLVAPVMISLNGGTTDMIPLPPTATDTLTQEFMIVPHGAYGDGTCAYGGQNVSVKLLAASASGSIYIGFKVKS